MNAEIAPKRGRPNIVFINVESMDGRKMGCMGHPALRGATPHMDRLAEEGVLFSNAYSNFPVCNPSRASMWTGKYPHYYDCWNNHEGLKPDVPIMLNAFQGAGYQTAAIGPLDYQYGKHSIRDRVGSWTRSARVMRPISRTPLPTVEEDGTLHGRDWALAHQSIAWMNRASQESRPFLLYLTTGLVHPAFRAEKRHMAAIPQDEIDIPPTLGPLDSTEHPVMRYMRVTKNCDKAFSEPMVRRIRHVYFAMIAALDELLGRVLGAVDDLGLAGSTYVVFTSDHGEMAGEQNQILKRNMYEPSIHVPLIVRGPDVRRGEKVSAPVSLVDLYPTFLDMAGIRWGDCASKPGYPETLDGESLMAQLAGNAERRRDWAFAEYHGDRCCTGAFMLRQGEWKYVKYAGERPQLFHLGRDPWEAENVAEQEPETAARMESTLSARFDCEAIDARAKRYDKENFRRWREERRAAGDYREVMSHVYSGFDRQCIEDLVPWSAEDEAVVEKWLEE